MRGHRERLHLVLGQQRRRHAGRRVVDHLVPGGQDLLSGSGILVPGLGDGLTSVSVGGGSVCAIGIGPNGGVSCWGNNAAPATIDSALTPDAQHPVSVGADSACELNANETAACWATTAQGRLGNGLTPTSSAVPILSAFP